MAILHWKQGLLCDKILSQQLTHDRSYISSTSLTLRHTMAPFYSPDEKAYKNIVGKGENAGNQHFFLFPQGFQPYER